MDNSSYHGAVEYMRWNLDPANGQKECRSMSALVWKVAGINTWARGVAAGYVAQAFGIDLSSADYGSQPYRPIG